MTIALFIASFYYSRPGWGGGVQGVIYSVTGDDKDFISKYM